MPCDGELSNLVRKTRLSRFIATSGKWWAPGVRVFLYWPNACSHCLAQNYETGAIIGRKCQSSTGIVHHVPGRRVLPLSFICSLRVPFYSEMDTGHFLWPDPTHPYSDLTRPKIRVELMTWPQPTHPWLVSNISMAYTVLVFRSTVLFFRFTCCSSGTNKWRRRRWWWWLRLWWWRWW